MGSADHKQTRINSNEKLISVKTSDLKARLNQMYLGVKQIKGRRPDLSKFDYLWDLKELALVEGRQTVDVPESWLDDVEKGLGEHGSRGH